jgi:hypothetical protein
LYGSSGLKPQQVGVKVHKFFLSVPIFVKLATRGTEKTKEPLADA